jgi:hypothetical protein
MARQCLDEGLVMCAMQYVGKTGYCEQMSGGKDLPVGSRFHNSVSVKRVQLI